MSVIQTMIRRLFGNPEARILIVGLDAAGKTTCLYRLKLGETVTTIPTIGFNVETVEYKTMSFTMWDVGGRDKIRPLWRHYYQGTQGIICVVDSQDRDRIDDAREDVQRMLMEEELFGVPLLVLANKQDLPNCLTAAEVSQRLGLREHRRRPCFAQATCATTGGGLHEGLEWLSRAIVEKKKKGGGVGIESSGSSRELSKGEKEGTETKAGSDKETKEEVLVEWLERKDNSDDEFLAQLADGSLERWDHRGQLRAAWLLLERHGRKEGMQSVLGGTAKFIEKTKLSVEAFHQTIAFFWVHMVHFAMLATNNPSGDFKGFLLMNPQLSNEELFLHYYTKEVILDAPAARTQVVLPDKASLPSVVSRTTASASLQPLDQRLLPSTALDDAAFLEHFRQKTLPAWGHDVKIRATWCLLREYGRRKGGTEKILKALEHMEGPGFNMSVAYFWLHMVTLAASESADDAEYADFAKRPRGQSLLDSRLIQKHYSDEALSRGALEMSLPDRAPLPQRL